MSHSWSIRNAQQMLSPPSGSLTGDKGASPGTALEKLPAHLLIQDKEAVVDTERPELREILPKSSREDLASSLFLDISLSKSSFKIYFYFFCMRLFYLHVMSRSDPLKRV